MIWPVWIFAVPALIACEETFTDAHFDIALSLAKHFGVAFCVFGKPDDGKLLHLLASGANPSKGKLLTGFLSFQEIAEFVSGNLDLKHGGRTMIVLTAGSNTLVRLSELSLNRSLSTATWLLFSESHFRPELFRHIYVPFDCEFICVSKSGSVFSLTEIYHIGRGTETETYDLGSWTEERGLLLSSVPFYSRRNSLKGHRLRAIIKNDPPYVTVEKDDAGNPKFRGYLYEIWSELEFRLNFRTDFPQNYFDREPDEVLKNEEVDFAVARISISPSAFRIMDFSHPINEAKFYLFAHRPGSELDWDSYLKPFSSNTWFVSILWMFSSSLALALLYRKAWDFGTSEREANYYVFTFSESLLTVFRAICMQGSDITPRSNSCRLFFLSIYLTALVVTSAFSAALFSLLTIPKPRSPFNSLEEVLSNNKFKIGFPSDPDFHKLVEEFSATLASGNQKKLLAKLTESKDHVPATPRQGIERICTDKLFIFMFDLPNVLYIIENTTRWCQDKILPSGPPLFTELIGFGFKKKNPYKEIINFHLIRMKNEGILKRLLLNYWPPQIPSVQATWVRVTLSDISPILYMFALGTILGTVFLHAEKVFLHFRSRKKRKANPNLSGLNHRLLTDHQMLLSSFLETKATDWNLYYKTNYKN